MPSFAHIAYYAAVVAWGASFYQYFLKDLMSVSLGIGRVLQPIEEFPFECRRLVHEQLEACEDMWIDEEKRVLYTACAGTQGRLAWSAAISKFNISARRAGGSELIALDIDSPGADGLFGMRAIKPVDFDGTLGDGLFDSVGFDAEIIDSETLRFYIVNQRPPVDEFNYFLDAEEHGANMTVEIFEMARGQNEMRHVQTVSSPAVITANRPAALVGGSFVVSNDHGVKTGLRKELEMLIGGGNVAYCSAAGVCHTATADTRMKFPNGLAKGSDGLIYVPSSADGTVRVFSLQPDNTLQLVHTIRTGMPLDNISPDAKGDLYVAGFPLALQTMKGLSDPYGEKAPSTVLRIRKTAANQFDDDEAQYVVEKVIEDKEGKIIAGATTVRHDVKTGRLFIGAAVHPFLVVCDPK